MSIAKTFKQKKKERKIHFINTLVSYEEKCDKSICLVENCGKELSGRRFFNIKRHYKLAHGIIIDNNVDFMGKTYSISKTSTAKSPSVSLKIRSPKIKRCIKTSIDKNEFLRCCVGLGTQKNIPLRIFDDNDFFKKIIKPYEEKFKINLNSTSVISVVEKASKEIKKTISERVKNKMVSVKIDIATRTERSILGINIQYIEDFKLHVNTIGMAEVTNLCTIKDIKHEISRCLQGVGIQKTRVYPNTKYISDTDLEKVELSSQVDKIFSVLKCTADNLRLAAHEVLKKIEPEVNECRKLAKKLRNSRIENLTFDIPNFNNFTKWETIYSTIECLLSQRDYIEAVTELMNIKVDWEFIEKFTSAFNLVFRCSSKSQTEQYILGDFYRDWLNCELQLQVISLENCYADYLHEAMTNKKRELFDHTSFLATLYLDPRFNYENSPLLTEHQKKIALNRILEIYEIGKELEIIKIPDSEYATLRIPRNLSPDTPSTSEDTFSKLTKHVEKIISTDCRQLTSLTSKDLKEKLLLLCERRREPMHINVLEYWKLGYQNEPEFCQLVEIVLSTPASQLSTDRCYSALSTILSKLGNKISKSTLENIFLCKLNFHLLRNYDFELSDKEIILDICN